MVLSLCVSSCYSEVSSVTHGHLKKYAICVTTGAQREPPSLCPWGMQKQSASPQEHLTVSADLPPVNCKEISGPEDSMCLHPG